MPVMRARRAIGRHRRRGGCAARTGPNSQLGLRRARPGPEASPAFAQKPARLRRAGANPAFAGLGLDLEVRVDRLVAAGLAAAAAVAARRAAAGGRALAGAGALL